jgi:hypothetical protein
MKTQKNNGSVLFPACLVLSMLYRPVCGGVVALHSEVKVKGNETRKIVFLFGKLGNHTAIYQQQPKSRP